MKMPDGGFRPAYNTQLATDTESRVVVGVFVTQAGNDSAQALPMIQEIERRTGQKPKQYLFDGSYTNRETVEELEKQGIEVYGSIKAPANRPEDRYKPNDKDPPAYARLKERMKTPEAQEIYKERCSTIETVNADAKAHRGMTQFQVRGIKKVLSSVLWVVLTYNILRWIALTPIVS
jgi:hypothetical protein